MYEPAHEIMALFILCKFIPQRHMRSHPVGLDVWLLVGLFIHFHTLCVETAKALLVAFVGRLCDKYHNLMSWLILTLSYFHCHWKIWLHDGEFWCLQIVMVSVIWAASWQNQQNECAPSEDSDQPGHLGCSATLWVHSKDSDQTGCMPKLIWVFAGPTCHFVGFIMRRLNYYVCRTESREVKKLHEQVDQLEHHLK